VAATQRAIETNGARRETERTVRLLAELGPIPSVCPMGAPV
jgi:hypothetical protein